MCGIAGIFTFDEAAGQPEFADAVRKMTNLMRRRGPDDEGFWSDPAGHLQLGFRRLSILDLSTAGHQPMVSHDESSVIVFNGEIYNFLEIRRELEQKGIKFRSHSDTEVLLEALNFWEKEAIKRLNGMFAFAFYNRRKRTLILARDHAGIKPLYYMLADKGIIFTSQYDQLMSHSWSKPLLISNRALNSYFRLGYIPAPDALLENTHMLEPGAWLEVDGQGKIRQGKFFNFPLFTEPDLKGEEAYEAVDEIVTRAVKRHLVSDVPLGAFLSGGIDSPLVTAKAKMALKKSFKTFTLGTNGDEYDESPDAIRYAKELGVEHIIEHVSQEEVVAMLDDVAASCSEPFADYSIFPTLLISKLAKKHVTVMLSGDGGDEIFWGYNDRFSSVLEKMRDFNQSYWFRCMRWRMKRFFNFGDGYPNLQFRNIGDWYLAKHSKIPEFWQNKIFKDIPSCQPKIFAYAGEDLNKAAQWMRWNEFVGHLTMVLLKVDRASMHHSLEVRVPLLDREVVEVAARVDWQSCLDIQKRVGKQPLRYALKRHVHGKSTAKRGFEVPMKHWLKGPLKSVFEEKVLGRKEILGIPLCNAPLIKIFSDHLSGTVDYTSMLWTLLSLVLWEDRYYKTRGY